MLLVTMARCALQNGNGDMQEKFRKVWNSRMEDLLKMDVDSRQSDRWICLEAEK